MAHQVSVMYLACAGNAKSHKAGYVLLSELVAWQGRNAWFTYCPFHM